jgi:GNAT superfamily N-acetyltransferase
MNDVARDTSPEALAAAIEANTCDAFVRWGQALGAEYHDDGEVGWFVSGVPLQLWNGVVRARFTAGDVDAQIDTTLRHFAAHQVPMSWLVGPSTSPPGLGRLLEGHGLTLDSESPGMALDLSQTPATTVLPPGLTITEIGDGAALARWIETLVVGNEFPEVMREHLMQLYGRHGFYRLASVRYFLGAVDGQPVATSLLLLSAGVAGIYCVATVPSARGRGIGSAMTVAPLQVARDLGYRFGVLQSSQIGLNFYRRLGFQQHCTLGLYFGGGTGAPEQI